MRKGFTLVELLVTIGIIALIAALVLPAVGGAREKSLQGKTASNLRQVGAALMAYAVDHQGLFPMARGTIPYKASPADDEEISWQQQLDSYIGFSQSSDKTIGARKVFTAPTMVDRGTPRGDNSFFLGSYAAGYANGSTSSLDPAPVSQQRINRPSMHILAGEMGNKGQFESDDADKDDYLENNPAFGSKEPNRVVQILFADGHIGGFKSFDAKYMTVRYEGVKADGLGYSYSDP